LYTPGLPLSIKVMLPSLRRSVIIDPVLEAETSAGETDCEVSELWRDFQRRTRAMPCLWVQGEGEETGEALPGL